jgi:hypothetical protein
MAGGSLLKLSISKSSKIATARVQPADAPRILCGKQETRSRRRASLEVVQLLQVAVADVAARLVAFPDQARVPVRLVLLGGVHERRVPAPGVGAGEAHAALQQVHGRLVAHAAAALT